MKVQVYKLPATAHHKAEAKPAQFVFADNASDEIRGFIVGVDELFLTICLLSPVPHYTLPSDAIYVHSEVNAYRYLVEALLANTDMIQHWKELEFTVDD